MSKYKNKIVHAHGFRFDSIKELNRYNELLWLKKAGEIKDFTHQYKIDFKIDGKKIFTYKADFKVDHLDGSIEYEDVKGFDIKKQKYFTTPLFNLKKKLIEAQFGIKIKLV